MYYEDDFNAENQIPAQFLPRRKPDEDKIPTPQDFAKFKDASPISNNGAIKAAYAQHIAATYDEQQLYKELTAISNEVIECRNSILAKIY